MTVGSAERPARPDRGSGGCHGRGEEAVQLAGDVALEAAPDLLGGLALGGAAGDVGAGIRAAAHAGVGDRMNRLVQGAVTAAVEPMPGGASAAGLLGADAAEGGEGGLVAAPAGVGERHDDLGGADRADAALVGQPGGQVVDDVLQLGPISFEFAAPVAQRDRQPADLAVAYRLGAGGLPGLAAPGQLVESALGEFAAGQGAVGVVAVAQQRLEPVGLPGLGSGGRSI